MKKIVLTADSGDKLVLSPEEVMDVVIKALEQGVFSDPQRALIAVTAKKSPERRLRSVQGKTA